MMTCLYAKFIPQRAYLLFSSPPSFFSFLTRHMPTNEITNEQSSSFSPFFLLSTLVMNYRRPPPAAAYTG